MSVFFSGIILSLKSVFRGLKTDHAILVNEPEGEEWKVGKTTNLHFKLEGKLFKLENRSIYIKPITILNSPNSTKTLNILLGFHFKIIYIPHPIMFLVLKIGHTLSPAPKVEGCIRYKYKCYLPIIFPPILLYLHEQIWLILFLRWYFAIQFDNNWIWYWYRKIVKSQKNSGIQIKLSKFQNSTFL